MKKPSTRKTLGQMEGITPLCPLCGRELSYNELSKGGWDCRCGEFIPMNLVIDPFTGCTHGLGCNCGREKRK